MDGEESDATDLSISKSTSISFSEDTAYSSGSERNDFNSSNTNENRRRKKKVNILELEPETKLNHYRKLYKKHKKSKNFDKAHEELLKLPPLARLAYGDNDWKYAVACTELAQGYIEKKYSVQAVKYAEKAKNVILNGGISGRKHEGYSQSYFSLKVSEIYLTLGKSYLLDKKYENAENSLNKAWHVCTKTSHRSGSAVTLIEVDNDYRQNVLLEIKQTLAEVYIKLKKAQMAIDCLLYTKDNIVTKEGPKSRLLLPVYKNMAKAEKLKPKSERNYDLVVEYCKEAHIIASEKSDDVGEEMADSAFNLAQAYLYFEEDYTFKAAETYLNEALQLYSEMYDKNHAKVLKTKDALCKLMVRTEREEEAVKMLKQLLKTKTRLYGEYNVQVADTHKLIGSIFLSQGKLKESHQYLKMCCEIEEQIYGKSHWKTKSTYEVLQMVARNPELSSLQDNSFENRPHFNTVHRSKK